MFFPQKINDFNPPFAETGDRKIKHNLQLMYKQCFYIVNHFISVK